MPFLRFNHSQTANKQVELPIAPSALPAAVLVRQKVDIGAQDDGGMLALSDSQLRTIWNAIDRDLDDAVRLALRGLVHESAA